MGVFSCPALERCLELHPDTNAADLIRTRLAEVDNPADLLPLYEQLIPVVETVLWASNLDPDRVERYHALFVEMEGHIDAAGSDQRHRLVVVVPVADRPQQLRTCLMSLVGAAQAFGYSSGKLAVVIADDSCAAEHIIENRAIAAGIDQLGIETIYFGQEQQLAELDGLVTEDRQVLQNIIGSATPGSFCHKGASIMRNITCLMLNRMAQRDAGLLFLFVDSDQEFHANTDAGREVFTTNYFYHIDRIFRQSQVEVLTGKVVGDPPVSPAVMAATLLEDVLAMLSEIAGLDADAPCTFHRDSTSHDNAAYHDMANLFGFEHSGTAHRYQCTLQGSHDHAACLSGFARRLNRFFDGEHPTRVTPYRHEDVQAGITPARTVYTGNYVLSPAALRYFIPFAGLQLRMAGPVLGRLIQAGSGAAFVSANLPLLHRRTVEATGGSEFRPGVNRSKALVDLSGEFERQFFGDVMLFTVIDLVGQGYPEQLPAPAEIRARVQATETRMRAHYAETRQRVLSRVDKLEDFVSDPVHWWAGENGSAETRTLFGLFAASLRANFDHDARSWQLLDDEAHRETRRAAIADALASYRLDRQSWERVLQG
ncbi:MAG: hypothetical protein ABFS24_13695 [Pseudomonadota bacterium]